MADDSGANRWFLGHERMDGYDPQNKARFKAHELILKLICVFQGLHTCDGTSRMRGRVISQRSLASSNGKPMVSGHNHSDKLPARQNLAFPNDFSLLSWQTCPARHGRALSALIGKRFGESGGELIYQ